MIERRQKRKGNGLWRIFIFLVALAAVGPIWLMLVAAPAESPFDPSMYGPYQMYHAVSAVASMTGGKDHEGNDGTSSDEDESSMQNVYICPPDKDNEKQGELNHFLYDGVSRSTKLRRTLDPDDTTAVWLVDIKRFNCDALIPAVKDSVARRRSALLRAHSAGGEIRNSKSEAQQSETYRIMDGTRDETTVPGWKIFMMDYSDSGGIGTAECPKQLGEVLGGREYLHLALRFHIKGRDIVHAGKNEEDEFAELGRPMEPNEFEWAPYVNGVPRILRYGVRSDQVDFYERTLNGVLRCDHGAYNSTALLGVDGNNVLDLVSLPRRKDVVHFWKIGGMSGDITKGRHRDEVSRAVQTLGTEHRIDVLAGTLGRRKGPGRNTIQDAYANALLQYKIVVICQRDRFEGHYRLMEALAGGAMVMTDPMLPLPVYLEDGDSVIVYRSIADLKAKILHYLKDDTARLDVARKGHDVAMKHHRSWQGIERIIHGDWLSPHGVQ